MRSTSRSPSPGDAGRWSARPRLAALVRAAILLGPVLLSVLSAWLTQRLLPAPDGWLSRVGVAAVMLGVSGLVLLLIDRVARRLVPLATLLDLTLLFPDQAPSRVALARRAARRRPLAEQLGRVAAAGDPNEAAREILGLVAALSSHDRPTRGHAERVRLLTDVIADQLGLPARDRDLLRWAALLHDIGKLKVPATLLNKPGKPDDAEWALLKSHPSAGAEIAAPLMPWLAEWGQVIEQHHERYDGTGYPTGIGGSDIFFGARIVAVADAYDVMTAARAYRRPVSRAAAYRELVRCSGSQFDPTVVRAMVSVSAPQLRRAQGVLSMLADLPLVATQTVPAATLARAVGTATLVAGAAVGAGGAAGAGAAQPPAPAAVASAPAPAATTTADPSSGAGSTRVGAPGTEVDAAPAPPSALEPDDGTPDLGSAPGTTGPAPRSGPPVPTPRPSTGTGAPIVDDAVAAAEKPVDTLTGIVGGTVGAVTGTVGAVTGAVGGAVTGVVGGVTETVGGVTGAAGGVTDAVGGAVTGAVGGVTGTVGGVTEGVGEAVDDTLNGGLLGSLFGRR